MSSTNLTMRFVLHLFVKHIARPDDSKTRPVASLWRHCQLFGISKNICTRIPLKLHKVPAPEPSGTSPSIFSAKTLRTLTRALRRNPPEPHKVSTPEPSGTSQGIYLPQNPPEPHHASSPIDPPESHQVAAPKLSIEPNQISAL